MDKDGIEENGEGFEKTGLIIRQADIEVLQKSEKGHSSVLIQRRTGNIV